MLAASLLALPAATASAMSTMEVTGQGGLTDPDVALGTDWRRSSDAVVTGVGDSDGFHLYLATEKNAFAWTTLATLTSSALDVGPWTGEVCVTGSGRYAVAVYAPALAVNKPRLMAAGGLAAVVDTRTGIARQVATGVQLAYFNPACGPGDTALLTRAIGADEQETDLLTVDAAAGRVTRTRRIAAQLTTPVPAPDGDYGIVHGALVRVSDSGGLAVVGRPAGQAYAVVATAHHGIDVVSRVGQRSVAQRFANGGVTTIGTGPWHRFQLFGLAGGRDVLIGDTSQVARAVPEQSLIDSDRRARAVSGQGRLAVVSAMSAQTAQTVGAPLSRPDRGKTGSMTVTVRATHSGRVSSATVSTTKAPILNTLATGAPDDIHALTDPSVSEPSCAIGRNDPRIQALQPSPDMVEWAVDQAVYGYLTVSRPADYLKTGQVAYTPQGLFPRLSLAGGGSVPAQLMLAILAQETNLSEASWHAVPGDTGNPLIADYYGNGNADLDLIDYDDSDCGYGIGQVTDNMRVDDVGFSERQQIAIATDYAANIAAGLRILTSKWNQIYNDNAGWSHVNDGDPLRIENWYLAVWAYNSGYHDSADAGDNNGHWGVGWLNNPANPTYSADRAPFLRESYGDAAIPSHWSYEEKVMGWAETPQVKGSGPAYSEPDFGANADGDQLTLPGLRTFCATGINSCDPTATGDPCPAESDACWWHGTVTFADCPGGECADGTLAYSLGASEPGVQRIYDRDCENFTGGGDVYRDVTNPVRVVYDLNDVSRYALGCSIAQDTGGKFTLRVGAPAGSAPEAYYAQIDLHQLGAGYNGHMWFTHVYPPDYLEGETNANHQVVGAWAPETGLGDGQTRDYDIVVHLPSHGGAYHYAEYVILTSFDDTNETCVIDQDTTDIFGDGQDEWVYLGKYTLSRGARVQLKNVGDAYVDGTEDIAFDAMAFIPVSGTGHDCGDNY